MLLKILDQIQQDNENVRMHAMRMQAICKEEGVSLEQVFYIHIF